MSKNSHGIGLIGDIRSTTNQPNFLPTLLMSTYDALQSAAASTSASKSAAATATPSLSQSSAPKIATLNPPDTPPSGSDGEDSDTDGVQDDEPVGSGRLGKRVTKAEKLTMGPGEVVSASAYLALVFY